MSLHPVYTLPKTVEDLNAKSINRQIKYLREIITTRHAELKEHGRMQSHTRAKTCKSEGNEILFRVVAEQEKAAVYALNHGKVRELQLALEQHDDEVEHLDKYLESLRKLSEGRYTPASRKRRAAGPVVTTPATTAVEDGPSRKRLMTQPPPGGKRVGEVEGEDAEEGEAEEEEDDSSTLKFLRSIPYEVLLDEVRRRSKRRDLAVVLSNAALLDEINQRTQRGDFVAVLSNVDRSVECRRDDDRASPSPGADVGSQRAVDGTWTTIKHEKR